MAKTPEHREPRTERHEHHIHQKKGGMEWVLEIGIALMVLGTLAATSIAAYWTSWQWSAANDQLGVMQDTERRQLRAYVGLIPKDVENMGDLERQKFTFVRKNYGTTPAYDLIITDFGQSIVPDGQSVPFLQLQQPPEILRGNVTLFPGAELSMTVYHVTTPKEQVDRVMGSDTITFVYWGSVKYRDAFDRTHFTNFCWSYKRNATTEKDVGWCGQHNDSD
jgi:hypothetical protein